MGATLGWRNLCNERVSTEDKHLNNSEEAFVARHEMKCPLYEILNMPTVFHPSCQWRQVKRHLSVCHFVANSENNYQCAAELHLR